MLTVTLNQEEWQFLLLFVQGFPDSMIAERLSCPIEVVSTERRVIFDRLKESKAD